jgi:hypothetical protein
MDRVPIGWLVVTACAAKPGPSPVGITADSVFGVWVGVRQELWVLFGVRGTQLVIQL